MFMFLKHILVGAYLKHTILGIRWRLTLRVDIKEGFTALFVLHRSMNYILFCN